MTNMTLYVILDKENQRVRGFIDGDIETMPAPPTQEFVAIEAMPTLAKPAHYYQYVDGQFVLEDAFEQEHYSRMWSKWRRQEYPPIGDYLDGVVKGDQAQIDAYIAACQAVKNKYPKPE